jgi:hypothetical protein
MREETSLWLKFSGQELDVRSIPIYELGDTLIAIQRILNKAHLYRERRLQKRAQLTEDERRRLSLQIAERKKGSDVYGLIPFAADPQIQQYLITLLKIGITSLGKYALGKVLEPSRPKGIAAEGSPGSFFAGAIYGETVQITNHIYNIGGIETIELIPGAALEIPAVKLTPATREYVREIANEVLRGEKTEITGYVTKLYPNRSMADIKLAPSRYVKVYLDEEAFEFVRYHTQQEEHLTFQGIPLLRLGKDEGTFQEFEAERVRRTPAKKAEARKRKS